jgi:anti-anti-sigma factor
MPVETSLSSDGSVLNIVLSGVFDINRSLQIQDNIDSFPDTVRVIRIDLEAVTSIDATIFSTLILLYFEKERKARIELINCDKTLARRLSLAGLDRLITIRMSATRTEHNSDDAEEKDASKDRQ